MSKPCPYRRLYIILLLLFINRRTHCFKQPNSNTYLCDQHRVSQLMTAVCVSMLLADQTVKCFACYSRKALCVVHLLFDVLKERPECCVRKVVVPGSYYCAKFNTTTTILIVMLLLLINSVLFSSVRKNNFRYMSGSR